MSDLSEQKEFNRMCDAVAKYLKRRGWIVVVSGPSAVGQDPEARPNNFYFRLDFTGSRIAVVSKGKP